MLPRAEAFDEKGDGLPPGASTIPCVTSAPETVFDTGDELSKAPDVPSLADTGRREVSDRVGDLHSAPFLN